MNLASFCSCALAAKAIPTTAATLAGAGPDDTAGTARAGESSSRFPAKGHFDIKPASGTRRNPQRKFDRFLPRGEARRLHAELNRLVAERPERAAQADIIGLLCHTGFRLSEIRTLRWREAGPDTLDLGDSKTGP